MSFLLCSSGAAADKAGANANATALSSPTLLNRWSDEAEGTFCMKTRKDWSSALAITHIQIKNAVADAVSDLIAIKIINYDMSGYTGLNEASTMCDILKDNYSEIVRDLREDSNQKLNK